MFIALGWTLPLSHLHPDTKKIPAIQKFGVSSKFFNKVFYAPHGCIYLIKNAVETVILWNIIIIKNTFSFLIYFNILIYPCDDKAEILAAITLIFCLTWSFRIHSNILILCTRNFSIIIINIENSCAA